MDLSGILDGLDAAPAVAAIISAGAILALPSFSKWATKQVAKFFG